MTISNGQGIVHQVKYNGGDCVIGYLRTLFPDLHSKHCDDAVQVLVDMIVKIVVPPLVDKAVELEGRRMNWIDNPMRSE